MLDRFKKIAGTEDDYEMVSVGPTTSMRMKSLNMNFLQRQQVSG